jgi:hypothetical protein
VKLEETEPLSNELAPIVWADRGLTARKARKRIGFDNLLIIQSHF